MSGKPKIITRQTHAGIKSAILGMIIMLAGCDTYMGGITNSDVRMECPPVTILSEAASITRYVKGASRSILDVEFTGRVIGIKGKCAYEFDSNTGEGTVEINVITKFKMKRGAANKNRQAGFQYFVSVVNDDGYILEKQIFPYSVKYFKNRTWVKDEDYPVELSVPLRGGKTGQDFTVYVGFQLSEEELEFNRK